MPSWPRCLWLMALYGPEALEVLCVLHHRRILETGKEVAGIHGFLGEAMTPWGPCPISGSQAPHPATAPALLFALASVQSNM